MQASIFRHSFTRHALGQQCSLASKRLISSSTEATQKKAQDALAAAQKNAGKFLDGAKKSLEPLGDKVGQLLDLFIAYKQSLLYNLAVTKEFKIQEGLQPPKLDAFKSAHGSLWSQSPTPDCGELGRVGVYGLQVYGIFKIGEIIGRRHVVGYKLD
ncbi:hypothetical protein CPC08DRAFT_717016 [Agrocybe pediades]|nr:hypothetical protein CPC08DRAFT_717016 [Agrocybe pediades]